MSGLGVPETFNSAATPNWKIRLHGANHLDEENFSQIFWDFFLSGLNSTKRKYYLYHLSELFFTSLYSYYIRLVWDSFPFLSQYQT